MSRIDLAINYKNKGLNCAEAILKAYSDVVDVDFEVLQRIGSGFGIGMGCFEATCGSLIGANIILGLLNNNPMKKTMTMSSKLVSKFKELSKDITCKVLKGIDTGVVLCKCVDCVKNACIALESVLKEEGILINA